MYKKGLQKIKNLPPCKLRDVCNARALPYVRGRNHKRAHKKLYFGAYDIKAGCCGTLYNIPADPRFNHRTEISGGVLKDKCGGLLRKFFSGKRKLSKRVINHLTNNDI